MDATCNCGTTTPSSRTCLDCGSPCCRSCSIELSANTYCLWCATSLARTAVS
jgi:hypothetical protein